MEKLKRITGEYRITDPLLSNKDKHLAYMETKHQSWLDPNKEASKLSMVRETGVIAAGDTMFFAVNSEEAPKYTTLTDVIYNTYIAIRNLFGDSGSGSGSVDLTVCQDMNNDSLLYVLELYENLYGRVRYLIENKKVALDDIKQTVYEILANILCISFEKNVNKYRGVESEVINRIFKVLDQATGFNVKNMTANERNQIMGNK